MAVLLTFVVTLWCFLNRIRRQLFWNRQINYLVLFRLIEIFVCNLNDIRGNILTIGWYYMLSYLHIKHIIIVYTEIHVAYYTFNRLCMLIILFGILATTWLRYWSRKAFLQIIFKCIKEFEIVCDRHKKNV